MGARSWAEPPQTTPIAAALAAAIHHAWSGPLDGASNRFMDAFRRLVGPEAADRHDMLALRVFQAQPEPPEGYACPPSTAHFAICPRCQKLARTKFTKPWGGRVRLQALRDAEWLSAQIERGRTLQSIGDHLGCTESNVARWCRVHGIESGKHKDAREFDRQVLAMHRQDRGPGGIAKELGTTADHVRQSLRRQGIATKKTGHVYFTAEWWNHRMRGLGWTKHECTREAGITPHAGTSFIHRFGLGDITAKNARRRRTKYPMLTDPMSLRALLAKHGDNYETLADEVGCSPSLVSSYARRVLGRSPKVHTNEPHFQRAWWEERIAAGALIHEMAKEAGVLEKTARERLRSSGLLDEAYKNEVRRERASRPHTRTAEPGRTDNREAA